MDEQIEYYPAVKTNELRHAATWMTLKNMVSERSQTQNSAACFYLYKTPWKSNL